MSEIFWLVLLIIESLWEIFAPEGTDVKQCGGGSRLIQLFSHYCACRLPEVTDLTPVQRHHRRYIQRLLVVSHLFEACLSHYRAHRPLQLLLIKYFFPLLLAFFGFILNHFEHAFEVMLRTRYVNLTLCSFLMSIRLLLIR